MSEHVRRGAESRARDVTRGRYRWALAVVAVSAFMITLDNTVVNVAMPTIKRTLNMSDSSAQWVATGYILMFSCLMIAGGRLTDVYGARVTFMTGMAIFTSSSLAAGLAHSDTVLILSRVVQGSGAALALPATLVIVTVGRSDKQRSLGTIVWIAASSISLAAGPSAGGFITEHWGWNWIFLLNVVPGIIVMLLAMVVVNGKRDTSGARVDLPGLLISATTLFALTYALEAGQHLGFTDPAVLSVVALAVIAGASFVVVERWAPDPMIDLEFFRNRTFTGGVVSHMLWGMGFNGVLFHGSFLLQEYLGFSPPQAGMIFLPPSVVLFLMTPVSFWLAMRIGSRMTIGGGMAVMAIGMALFGMLQRGDGYLDLLPGVMLVGVGSALTIPLAMYVLKTIPDQRVGVASGILNVVRELSGAFGIAVLGLMIETLKDRALDSGVGALEAYRQGAAAALIFGAALVLIGGIASALTLPRKAGTGTTAKPVTTRPKPRVPEREPVPVPSAAVREAEPVLVPAGASRPAGVYGPGYEPGNDPYDPYDLHDRSGHGRGRGREFGPAGAGAGTHERRHSSGRFAEVLEPVAVSPGQDAPAVTPGSDEEPPWWHEEEQAPRPVSNPYHSFDWYTPRNSKGQYEAQ